MLTSGGVASAQSNPVSSYDLNQNNRIDRDELLSVIRAHLFGGTATRGDVLQAIRYHLFDTPIQPETPVTTPSQSFGDGTWIVGSDIAPGLYVAPGIIDEYCSWERLSGFGGTFDEIIAIEFDYGRKLVEIASTDAAFKSDGCGLWTPITEIMFGPPRDYILEGFWRVGEEIIPGVYSIPDGESCSWERLSGFGGTYEDRIGGDFGGAGRQIVEIESTDIGFHSSGCGEWQRQDSE